MALKCAIVTPEQDVLSVDADEVVIPGIRGEIGFLPGHIALITALKSGVLTIRSGRKTTAYAVSSGFAEIENDILTILTHACEEAQTIDTARAQKAKDEANKNLSGLGPDDDGYTEQWRRLERAEARLNAVKQT